VLNTAKLNTILGTVRTLLSAFKFHIAMHNITFNTVVLNN